MAVTRQSNDNANKTLLVTTIDKPCYNNYVKKLLIKNKILAGLSQVTYKIIVFQKYLYTAHP